MSTVKPKTLTRTGRSLQLASWVQRKIPSREVGSTSAALAELATKELGFDVSANRMAKELYRQDVAFRTMLGDPPKPKIRRVDLLKVRVDNLEEKIKRLERAMKQLLDSFE